ncbi:hypothetical protein [uncultured Rothia sp.]|uniref:hypothetical protein n=1 Tax=uncultured Rothia sp. TaxID=316088 RepID=UPI0028E974FD|nr:hypothetical protein [uncultured Rothia sp.]
MVDYALGDRGSVDIVTDDYYEAETLQIFEELHIDRERIWYGEARLVPEPDNPYEPNSIAVYIDEFKVGRMSVEDSAAYWDPITRVVASGYEPIAHLQLSAVAVRAEGGGMHVKSTGVLSLSAPSSLFPLNDAPTRAALLPQGPSMKVLDEKEHSEYLHSILPPSGEGRVILTLEANQLKTSDGRFVDSVEVRHDRKLVGRLSTQMSEQLTPVIRYAFENDRLTSAWGTIRGNTLELSLTVQAARPADIPQEWYETLPNNVPALLPAGEEYEVPAAFVPTEGERHYLESAAQQAPKKRRGFMSSLTGGSSPEPTRSEPAAEKSVIEYSIEEEEYYEPNERDRLLNLVKGAGLAVLVAGLISMLWTPMLGILIAILGGAVAAVAFYFGRQPYYEDYEDYDEYEEEYEEEETAEDAEETDLKA